MGRFIRSRWLSAVLASLLVLWLRPLPASDAGCPDAELVVCRALRDSRLTLFRTHGLTLHTRCCMNHSRSRLM
jgi:hypothetical protein